MGPLELILILALALVVFGPDKLPEIARQIGKTVGDIRRMSSEVTGEIQRGLQLDEDRNGQRPTILPPATPSTPRAPAETAPPPAATPHAPGTGADEVRPPY
jgi:sec-independent protein translocase protein TatB